MKNRRQDNRAARWRLFLISGGIAVLDRLTKTWAELRLARPRTLIQGFVNLRLTTNTGGAFSLMSGHGWLMTFVTAAILIAVSLWYLHTKPEDAWSRAGASLTLGGGLGNLYDRVVYGEVTDFIELAFMRFPVFNVADIAVVAGVICLAIGILRGGSGHAALHG